MKRSIRMIAVKVSEGKRLRDIKRENRQLRIRTNKLLEKHT